MEDIRQRLNLVALVAAVGMLIALIGIIIAGTEFPGRVNILDIIIYGLTTFVALAAVRPSEVRATVWNIVLGLLVIFITAINYIRIAEIAPEQSFTGVGIGIWMAFAGAFLFTIFSISDYTYKRNLQKQQ